MEHILKANLPPIDPENPWINTIGEWPAYEEKVKCLMLGTEDICVLIGEIELCQKPMINFIFPYSKHQEGSQNP